jgi:hypothetical protein
MAISTKKNTFRSFLQDNRPLPIRKGARIKLELLTTKVMKGQRRQIPKITTTRALTAKKRNKLNLPSTGTTLLSNIRLVVPVLTQHRTELKLLTRKEGPTDNAAVRCSFHNLIIK